MQHEALASFVPGLSQFFVPGLFNWHFLGNGPTGHALFLQEECTFSQQWPYVMPLQYSQAVRRTAQCRKSSSWMDLNFYVIIRCVAEFSNQARGHGAAAACAYRVHGCWQYYTETNKTSCETNTTGNSLFLAHVNPCEWSESRLAVPLPCIGCSKKQIPASSVTMLPCL